MTDHTTNDTSQEIPYGYCHCGCGNLAPIAKKSNPGRGYAKGQPVKFILNHYHNTFDYIKYFHDHVSKTDGNNCWLWTGTTDIDGYGTIVVRRRLLKAHRYSFELHYGIDPASLWVLHRCDNPACVNPAHLFLGTPKDNVDDMMAKKRHRPARGEESGTSKLTNENVLLIRQRLLQGEPQSSIARDFGVSQSIISDIHRRVSWKHI